MGRSLKIGAGPNDDWGRSDSGVVDAGRASPLAIRDRPANMQKTYRLLPQQRVQEQRNSGDHGGTGRLHDRIHVTARRFVAAVEEKAGCKSGHALAAGLKWVGDGSDWEACFEDRRR